jgi:hypothetical protein
LVVDATFHDFIDRPDSRARVAHLTGRSTAGGSWLLTAVEVTQLEEYALGLRDLRGLINRRFRHAVELLHVMESGMRLLPSGDRLLTAGDE